MLGFLPVFFSKAASFCRASLFGMRDDWIHVVGGFNVLQVNVLAWVVVALGRGRPCGRAADVLGHTGTRGCGRKHRDRGLKSPASELLSQCFHSFLLSLSPC